MAAYMRVASSAYAKAVTRLPVDSTGTSQAQKLQKKGACHECRAQRWWGLESSLARSAININGESTMLV